MQFFLRNNWNHSFMNTKQHFDKRTKVVILTERKTAQSDDENIFISQAKQYPWRLARNGEKESWPPKFDLEAW